MSATVATVAEGLQMIPLAAINSNPDNPRKHFDDAALKELAASIRAQGVWEPVVVRPDPLKPKTFELVIGERRWRASKLAGKSDIPAIVRNLSDRESLEAMILENLQRVDVHPMEEARGYQMLLESGTDIGHPAHTVDTIAAKIGKSPSYVYARLKLLVLIPAVAEAFRKDYISAGHAVLIARLQPADQLRALSSCFKDYITGDEEAQLKKFDAGNASFNALFDGLGLLTPTETENDLRVASEKSLRVWIQDHINLKLKGVPWDLADAQLVPDAGACTTCPKRSLSNPMLFAELTHKGEDTCFDPACYQNKRKALVKLQFQQDRDRARSTSVSGTEDEFKPLRQLSEQRAWNVAAPDQKTLKHGQWLDAKKGECNDVERGVITKGEHAGEQRLICANAACKVHKHNLQKLSLQKPEAALGPRESDEEREKRQRADKAWSIYLRSYLAKSVNGADRAALLMLGKFMTEDVLWKDSAKLMKELASLPLAKAWSQLAGRVLIELASDRYDSDAPNVYAKARKLDLDKLEKGFRASYEAQASAKQQPAAKKGVSKKKSGAATKPSRPRH